LTALKSSCLTPLPSSYENPRLEQPLPSCGGCFNLGLMYEEGKGVKQDDFKALKFFQKACDLNDGITRLLVKLECFEIILFNAFAFVMHKSKIRATTAII
jgi:hypothetical protein